MAAAVAHVQRHQHVLPADTAHGHGHAAVAVLLSGPHIALLDTASGSSSSSSSEATPLATLRSALTLYRNIPHFPAVSSSRSSGGMALGTLAGFPVWFITVPGLEGLAPEDASFVVELLVRLGVRSLVVSLTADSTDAAGEAPTSAGGGVSPPQQQQQIVYLTDCVASHTVTSGATSAGTCRQLASDVTPLSGAHLSAVQHHLMQQHQVPIQTGVYMHVLGPSYPTPSEVAVARALGCSAVGPTSLSAVYVARGFGMPVVALAETYAATSAVPRSPATVIRAPHSSNVAHMGAALAAAAAQLAAHPPQPQQVILPVAKLPGPRQGSYNLAQPITQGNYEFVQQSAQFIKERFAAAVGGGDASSSASSSPSSWLSSVPLVILVDSHLSPYVLQPSRQQQHVRVLHSVPFNDIPNTSPREAEAVLQLVELSDGNGAVVRAWVVRSSAYLNQGRSASDVVYPIRVLGTLGVTSALVVAPVASVDSASLAVNDLFVAADHVMYSARNPLFGPNEDRWGVRFPDVSNCYNKTLLRSVCAAGARLAASPDSRPASAPITAVAVAPPAANGEASAGAVKVIKFAHVVGPVLGSRAEAASLRFIGMQAVSTGIAPEVLTAHHMHINTAAIGIVTAAIDTDAAAGSDGKPVN
jgi:purine-nucleoside phosphorylase